MRNVFKAATSIGSVALVLSGAAMAAAPTSGNFDQWSVSSGSINASCPTGYSCGVAVTGDGFFQRQIVDTTAGGKTYFQTIITDTGATATQANLSALTFGDESFVETQNPAGGILDKQRLSQTLNADTFSGATTIKSGWAQVAGASAVEIAQGLQNTAGNGFRTDFNYEAGAATDASGNPVNFRMKIAGRVGLTGSAADLISAANPAGDWQEFLLAEAKGTYVAAGGTLSLPGGTRPNGTSLTSISYAAGNDIKGVYVGQDMTATVGQEFGYQNFDNISDNETMMSKFGLTAGSASGPTGWPALFGTTTSNTGGF